MTSNGTAIYASTYEQGIFKSFDDGVSWMPVNNGLESMIVYEVRSSIDPEAGGAASGRFTFVVAR